MRIKNARAESRLVVDFVPSKTLAFIIVLWFYIMDFGPIFEGPMKQ